MKICTVAGYREAEISIKSIIPEEFFYIYQSSFQNILTINIAHTQYSIVVSVIIIIIMSCRQHGYL